MQRIWLYSRYILSSQQLMRVPSRCAKEQISNSLASVCPDSSYVESTSTQEWQQKERSCCYKRYHKPNQRPAKSE